MFIKLDKRLSHTEWRKLLKTKKRKNKRIKEAKLLEAEEQKKMEVMMSNPLYIAQFREAERMEEETKKIEEEIFKAQKTQFLKKDTEMHAKFTSLKSKQQQRDRELLEAEEKIRQEWEQKVQADLEAKKLKQSKLSQPTTSGSNEIEVTQNPEPPSSYRQNGSRGAEQCPFFLKTGACRFGPRCSREHVHPVTGQTILIPNMYTNVGLHEELIDDFDCDSNLAFSELESQQHFSDFFFDVLEEFKKYGNVIQFKVCCNKSVHLRGNVYIQYQRTEQAEMALGTFNGRWYGGRQLSCMFAPIERWKPAICGLYFTNRCPKGDQCNFLHVYRNPGNMFSEADKDSFVGGWMENPSIRGHYGTSSRRSRRSLSPAKRSTRKRSKTRDSRRSKSRDSRRSKSRDSRRSKSRDSRRSKSRDSRRSKSCDSRPSKSRGSRRSKSRDSRRSKSRDSRRSKSRDSLRTRKHSKSHHKDRKKSSKKTSKKSKRSKS